MNANVFVADIFVDELARGGLRHACIAPGSRSTPLTLAFSAHPDIAVHSLLDERSAGFFALGLAMATQQPVAMLCTSGSAAANFFPAVVEARMSNVPLIVLTADRPHELRHSGANQTIDQIKLYGHYALWSVDMALPEASPAELSVRNVRTTAARALATAGGLTKSVVHINFPFRKPLEPTPEEALQHVFTNEARPFTRITHGRLLPDELDVSELARLIATHERGVIVCGPRCEGDSFSRSVAQLSERSGYPIFADALSGLRFGNPNVISCYDAFLSHSGASVAFTPDVVIRFGAVPTSATLCNALSRSGAAHRIHVVQDDGWADDDHRTTWLLQADPTATCDALAPHLGSRGPTEWSLRVHRFEHESRTMLQEALGAGEWFDGAAVHELLEALPEGARLFAGNSLPIRHVDEFGFARRSCFSVFGSRGASGIDGNISTALGIAAADLAAPCVALVGDVTLYHDMNGLLAVRRFGLNNATIIVLNNNGGGIFHRLPVARLEPPFTQLFLTPHDLNFEHAAALYNLNYVRANNREELRACLHARFSGQPGSAQFIEVPTDARRDLAQRKAIGDSVLEKIK